MRWALNMIFCENQCRVRTGDTAQNFAILRHIDWNLLKRHTPN
ncbi:hypothetical protein PQQ52_06460 [Paraburkholderia sediminicola]